MYVIMPTEVVDFTVTKEKEQPFATVNINGEYVPVYAGSGLDEEGIKNLTDMKISHCKGL